MGAHQVLKPRSGPGFGTLATISTLVIASASVGVFSLLARTSARQAAEAAHRPTATASATGVLPSSALTSVSGSASSSAPHSGSGSAPSTSSPRPRSTRPGVVPTSAANPSAPAPTPVQPVQQPWLSTPHPVQSAPPLQYTQGVTVQTRSTSSLTVTAPAVKSVSLTCSQPTTLEATGSGGRGNVLVFGGTSRSGASITITMSVGPGTYVATDTDPEGAATASIVQLVATAMPCHA